MTVQSILTREMVTLRETGGYARDDSFGLLEVYGPDAQRFLQSQTTNDVQALAQYGSQESCIIDRKAHVIAYFRLYRKHESYRIIAQREQIAAIIAHLESHKFADKVDFVDLTTGGAFLVVQGPRSLESLTNGFKSPSELVERDMGDQRFHGVGCHFFKYSLTGEPGYFLWFSLSDLDTAFIHLEGDCKRLSMIDLTPRLIDVARIEMGLLKFNVDFNSDTFLPETSLDDQVVSYTKGCFLGQEVLTACAARARPPAV